MASDEQILRQLRPICAKVLSVAPEAITLEADLRKDLEADSLDIAEMTMAAEEEFGLQIDESAGREARTVADVVALLRRTAEQHSAPLPA